jgi:hypothetical protein
MKLRPLLLATAIAVMPLVAACGSSNNSPTTPTPPQTTETFTGTINQNSAATITFEATTAGPVAAGITALEPVATVQIGFALGTWDGSACQVVIVNPRATTGSQVAANASTKGTYCVHLYDIGQITADAPLGYTVSVSLP